MHSSRGDQRNASHGQSLHAAFPPVVVINGSPSAQAGTGISSGSVPYSEYDTTSGGGVLVLYGTCGGDAAWGTSSNVYTSPTNSGTWGLTGVSFSSGGPTVVLPQVTVLYSGTVTPAAIHGYDGVQHQPLASGTTGGNFVVTYNGLSDGYIFNFGTGTPNYRYQFGPSSMVLNAAGGWPAPNIFVFPSQITYESQTLNATSYTDGIHNGYWSNIYYEGSGTYGELHVYIAPSGTSAEMYGDVDGNDVSATWNATTSTFVANSTLGLSFSGSSPTQVTPQYGPPKVEWNGTIIPFAYSDVNGSDVYWNASQGMWTVITGSDVVTVTNSYTTVTGSYDPTTQSFADNDNNTMGDFCAVSADGKSFLGLPSYAVELVISGTATCPGFWQLSTGNGIPCTYSLHRSDGTALYLFDITQCISTPFIFQFDNSPWYQFSGGQDVISGTNGWPAGLIATSLPTGITINGMPFKGDGMSSGIGWMSESYFDTQLDEVDESVYVDQYGVESAEMWGVPNINGNWGLPWGTVSYNEWSVIINGGTYSPPEYSWYLLSISPGTPTNTPHVGPYAILCSGDEMWFSYNLNGVDLYVGSQGETITIDSNGGAGFFQGGEEAWMYGSYNPNTYQFSFGPPGFTYGSPYDPAGTGVPYSPLIIAQDSTGAMLGLPAGVTVYASTPSQSIYVPNNTGTNVVTYTAHLFNGQWEHKYTGLPNYTLCYIQDGNLGASPVYSFTAANGDTVVNSGTTNAWPQPSNVFPPQIYVNGDYFALDYSSINNSGTGQSSYGSCNYFSANQTGVNLYWNPGFVGEADYYINVWTDGYGDFEWSYDNISWTWDCNQMFTPDPTTGNFISFYPPEASPQSGVMSIVWNGIDLSFNQLASSVNPINPTGGDAYTDSSGLGISAVITPGSNGNPDTVVLTAANGTQYQGTYVVGSYSFNINGTADGVSAGSVFAGNSNGDPLLPTSTGTNGSPGVEGNFDVQGNIFSLGSWTNTSVYPFESVSGISLYYTDGGNNNPSFLSFTTTRQNVAWTWSHANVDEGNTQIMTMELDPMNRLGLFTPSNSSTPSILLDPSGYATFNDGVALSGTLVPVTTGTTTVNTMISTGTNNLLLVPQQGDLLMGPFVNGIRPPVAH